MQVNVPALSKMFLLREMKKIIAVLIQIYVPYFSIDNARVIYTKKSKFVKNEHALYKLEYFSIDNASVIHTKGLNS
jgi:hypothetical protein